MSAEPDIPPRRTRSHWWHGSPYKLEPGDKIVPGYKLALDRYMMERNRAVFVSPSRDNAAWMGDPTPLDNHCFSTPQPLDPAWPSWYAGIEQAPWLYAVQPLGMYATTEDRGAPHSHIVSGERQCRSAIVIGRWKLWDPRRRKRKWKQALREERYTFDCGVNVLD